VRLSQLGKLNKETAAAKLDKSTTLLKAFTKHLAHKNTTIHSLGDNAR
jgi:hypothetical protein